MTPIDRARLRREMRARRRALSAQARTDAARRIAQIAIRSRLLKPGRRIAVYLAHGGEADLRFVIAAARRRNCILYLPAIVSYRAGRMTFRPFDSRAALRANRYGILEPASTERCAAAHLDLVFAPLVAFDERGSRVGSGAGFYDRALQRLRAGRLWRRPRIVGVGYEFQRSAALDRAPWDVPLDAALTEKRLYRTSQR